MQILIDSFYELLFPVKVLKEVKLPKYDLITCAMELCFKELKNHELLDFSCTNKNSSLLVNKVIATRKINQLINCTLNLKIKGIYSFKNYEKRREEESKLANSKDFDLLIESTNSQLGILRTEFTDSIAKKCLMNYFLRIDLQFLTNVQVHILKELTNDYIDKNHMGEILKIVKQIDKCSIKDELIKTLFHGFMETRYFNKLENNCTFKKGFIKILLQEKYYNRVCNFAAAYFGTSHEYEIVEYVLINLYLRGKIDTAISFLTKEYNQYEYLSIIPKLSLRCKNVDSAISYAKKVHGLQFFHQGKSIDPEYCILKMVIEHHCNNGNIKQALDVLLLIEDQSKYEYELYYLIKKCITENEFDLIKQMLITIENEETRHQIDDLIINFALDKFLEHSTLYTDLNDVFSKCKNSAERLKFLSTIIKKYVSNTKIDISKYQQLFYNKEIFTPKNQENRLIKFLVHKYCMVKTPLEAIEFALLLPSNPYPDRSIAYYKIGSKLLLNNDLDLSVKTNQEITKANLKIAIQCFKSIDIKSIYERAKKKFQPIINKLAQELELTLQ